MTRIILLDVDGVLVRPGGYRAALRATVNHFLDSYFDMDEETLAELERRGISSEWDMAPLLLASYFNSILLQQPMQNLPDDVSAAAREMNRQRQVAAPTHVSIPQFDLVAGQYPAETAFHAGCFSEIPHGFRKNLLTQTRNVHASDTIRVFQHFTLGSKKFAATYHLPAEFETESFLLAHDTSNINDEIRSKLRQRDHRLVAFTARPSGPPCEVAESTVGYAPEAELALELVNLQDIPLIAFGKLEYIAAQHQLDPAALVKPSPFQALAGTLAAWTGEELSALQAAYDWHRTGALSGRFSELPKSFELIVVEDTMGGIRSARAAGEMLQRAGLEVNIRAVGLTSGNSAKASAFERAGVRYFQDWASLIIEGGL